MEKYPLCMLTFLLNFQERKENMEPNVDCPNQSSTTRTCRIRRSINYKFTEFDELIDSAIQDDLRTVTDPDIEGKLYLYECCFAFF